MKSKVKSKASKILSRKETRKLKKIEKKGKKHLFFSNKKNLALAVSAVNSEKGIKSGAPKKRLGPKIVPKEEEDLSEEDAVPDIKERKAKSPLSIKTKTLKPTPKIPSREDILAVRNREKQKQKDLESQARKQRIKQLMRENEEEDKLISKLEKKLKLNKTKDKNRLVRKMFNDGLDYALEFCLNDDLEDTKETKASKASKKVDDDIDLDPFDESDTEMEESKAKVEETVKKPKEDIYGRDTVDPEVVSTESKYVPPQKRALLLNNDEKQKEKLENLKKSCKGLLNRLSEANLHKIATGIEQLYMKNARFNMNETLAALLLESLIKKTMVNERMVQEHIVLIGYLHASVGNEIGAHFLQVFVKQFNDFLNEVDDIQIEDKRLNNVVLVISYMYLFKIYEHYLLKEIIERLSRSLCEKTIECLLIIFRSVGFKLRKENPADLKDIILSIQQRILEVPLELKENLRLKFMVETLNAIKNNNMSKIAEYDPQLGETLKKRLKGMLRDAKYVVTLNISFDDLLRAEKDGKWWIVGSAWSGKITDAASAQNQNQTSGSSYSEELLALAKKNKMNTKERQNIFCIIMMANDYIDAFQNIMHLNLKDQRNIAYIVVHCVISEKQTNPFYSYLALKFCNYSRKFQLAYQFAIWDRLHEISTLNKQQIKNLAWFCQHLILNGGLVLSVLKVVDFLQLNKMNFFFMREVMKDILLHSDEKETYAVFERIAKNDKIKQFKQSLQLFMSHFLLKEESLSKLKLTPEQVDLLKRRVEYANRLLISDI